MIRIYDPSERALHFIFIFGLMKHRNHEASECKTFGMMKLLTNAGGSTLEHSGQNLPKWTVMTTYACKQFFNKRLSTCLMKASVLFYRKHSKQLVLYLYILMTFGVGENIFTLTECKFIKSAVFKKNMTCFDKSS